MTVSRAGALDLEPCGAGRADPVRELLVVGGRRLRSTGGPAAPSQVAGKSTWDVRVEPGPPSGQRAGRDGLLAVVDEVAADRDGAS